MKLNRFIIKKFFLVSLLTLSALTDPAQAILCDEALLSRIQDPKQLRSYRLDCELKKEFARSQQCYRDQGKNIADVQIYRALRLIDRSTYEKQKDKKNVWEIYSPQPKVWTLWEQANLKRFEIQSRLSEQQLEPSPKKWNLTLEDLQDLHKSVVNKEVLGWRRFIPKVSEPGKIRSAGNRAAWFTISREEYEQLKSDPLVKNHSPGKDDGYLRIGKKLLGGYYVQYTDSKYVKEKMNAFMQELNSEMNQFLQFSDGHGESPSESPLEFALRMQRKYVAIHPFHEGVGRTSRMIQEMILGTLGFPYLPNGDLQTDITTPQRKYVVIARRKMKEMNTSLKKCCALSSGNEEESPADCKLLYSDSSKEVRSIIAPMQKSALCDGSRGGLDQLQSTLLEYSELGTGLNREENQDAPGSIQIQFKNDKEKYAYYTKLLESLAVPIQGVNKDERIKLKTYTWVTSRQKGRNLKLNTRLFNWLVRGTSKKHVDLASKGFGLYVSRNAYDSSDFGIKAKSGSSVGANSTEVASSIDSQSPWLYEVEIEGKAKILHLYDPKVKSILRSVGFFDDPDIFQKISPDIIIDHSSRDMSDDSAEPQDWMNIMLKQRPGKESSFHVKFSELNKSALQKLSIGEILSVFKNYRTRGFTNLDRIRFVKDVLQPVLNKRETDIAVGVNHVAALPDDKKTFKGFIDQLLKTPEIRQSMAAHPISHLRKGYFWSQLNTCMEIKNGVIGRAKLQEMEPLGNACFSNELKEKKHLFDFLNQVKQVIDQQSQLSVLQHIWLEKLEQILERGKPFVTLTGKCAIVSAGKHIEYIDKDLCAELDLGYEQFISHYHF